jgi:soluble lytic murein transglycosylase-like protein
MPSDISATIDQYAKQYGVDPNLGKAIATNESGSSGWQAARSSAGAIGVMQLMPGTASSLGVNPYNQQDNIKGGIKYLAQLQQQLGTKDPATLAAAYNAGPAAGFQNRADQRYVANVAADTKAWDRQAAAKPQTVAQAPVSPKVKHV